MQENSKKRRNLKLLVISATAIVLVSLVVVILLLVLQNKEKDTPPEEYSGVRITNVSDYCYGSNTLDTSDPMCSTFLYYLIETDKKNYKYNEEFELRCNFGKSAPDGSNLLLPGDIHIVIEAKGFEILTDKEYIFSDFENPKYNITENSLKTILPISCKFRLKAKELTNNVDSIKIKLMFNEVDNFEQLVGCIKPYMKFDSEYLYVFEIANLNYSKEILLKGVDDQDTFEDISSKLLIQALEEQYGSGSITKEEYVDQIMQYSSDYTPSYNFDGPNSVCYVSENLRLSFKLNIKYKYLYGKYYLDTSYYDLEIVKELLGFAMNQKVITKEQYDSELIYLNDKLIGREIKVLNKRLITIKDFDSLVYKSVIVEN